MKLISAFSQKKPPDCASEDNSVQFKDNRISDNVSSYFRYLPCRKPPTIYRYSVKSKKTQFSKTFDKIPAPDTAISTGCEVAAILLAGLFTTTGACPPPSEKAMRFSLKL